LERIDKELGQLFDKLEKKLQEYKLEVDKEGKEKLVPDSEFGELSDNIIEPIMFEYKKFLETKGKRILLSCIIEKPHPLLQDISFELRDSNLLSKYRSIPRITFFPKDGRVHIFEEGTLGDGHPIESSYNKNEITEDFVRKRLTGLIKEYVDKLLNRLM
jgi:hypothetical protein